MQDLEKAAEDPDEDEPEFDMKCEALLPVLRRELPGAYPCPSGGRHRHSGADLP